MQGKKTYACSLAKLLKGICHVPAGLDTMVSGIAIDSRVVKKGDLFIAVSGSKSKSTDHIKEAIERGANAIVAEGTLYNGKVFEEQNVVELFVDDLRSKVGMLADRFYDSPSKALCVIGVTGTNGKTSVTNYLAMYFSAGGKRAATIGTLGYGVCDASSFQFVDTGHTTPDVVQIQQILAGFRDQGVEVVAMEVSSHGLDQGRVDAIAFSGAVFTNLTREHLDYHGSMECYGETKKKLFACESLKFAVVNNDDPFSSKMLSVLPEKCARLSYGLDSSADISVLKFDCNENGIEAAINTPVGQLRLASRLMGDFNLSNILAVVSVALALEDIASIETRLEGIKPVSGRLELVEKANAPKVVVDYAHTPDALKSILAAIRPFCSQKLILVFGCGGDRDIGKRAEMAEVAEQLSDVIFVTDDNPRNEAPEAIVNDIMQGFSADANVSVIHDRKLAIQQAIFQAELGDLVVVAGKGHEKWQEVRGEKSHFCDVEAVECALSRYECSTEGCSI